IKKDVLAYRFGGETAEQWLAIFREYRWDLEEEAEALILAQQEVGDPNPQTAGRFAYRHEPGGGLYLITTRHSRRRGKQ
ncbi:DUF1488 domain-containing protein, partial [Salmonella enterica subsp. enterica serovar Cerro]|nr:DUF1488 domain-containing protein [Salmonella enterica subsp. enterica serovar Cerro]